MSATRGNDKGIISVTFGCGSEISGSQEQAIDIGTLKGRYAVLSWPNATQRLFRNTRRSAQYVAPGAILDFGEGEDVYIEASTLLTSYQIELMPLQGREIIQPVNRLQWQRVANLEIGGSSDRAVDIAPLRVSGLLFARVSATEVANVTLTLSTICSSTLYSWAAVVISNVRPGVGIMDDLGVITGIYGEDHNIKIATDASATGTYIVELGGAGQSE